jgi:hypothetical protein
MTFVIAVMLQGAVLRRQDADEVEIGKALVLQVIPQHGAPATGELVIESPSSIMRVVVERINATFPCYMPIYMELEIGV